MKHNRVHLTLFFTRGVSLQTWENVGMFDREVALYRRLQEYGLRITFVTYGDKRDLEISKRLPGIRIICNRWNWEENRYIRWITSSFPWLGRKPNIIKSNQFSGAEVALAAARQIGCKFIARGGNIPSFQLAYQDGPEAQSTQMAILNEKDVLPAADKVVVATPFMVQLLREQYAISSNKIEIIPNYVMTDVFKPALQNHSFAGRRLCFIGRLEEQKNLNTLLMALKGLDIELDIVGSGSLRRQLESFAIENNLRVNFLGNIPNSALPTVICTADVYIQPSLYEGHPKTIIEAMSCGAAIIASNSPGIRDLITHRQNGYLCTPTPDGIRMAITEVLSDSSLRCQMQEAARQYAVDNFSLERIVQMELNLYERLLFSDEI